MTVYVDDMKRPAKVGRIEAEWSHLLADTDDELHAFAVRLGLKRAWFQKPGTPIAHYDVTEPKRQQAIKLGAVQIGYMSTASTDLIRRKREALLAERATPVAPAPAPPAFRSVPFCPGCGLFHATRGHHRADCTAQPEKRETT